MAFIAEASRLCKVALAHTSADYDVAMRAFENGATHVTHLFNAMNPFLHRSPGLVGAAIDAGAYVELISDGVHLHPSMVRAAYKMFGGKVCMISDSIRSAGLPDGRYESGGMSIVVSEGKATLENGVIAGSNISLMDGVRYAARFGVPLEKVLYAATMASAKAIGMEGEIGCIAPGAYADMVMLDSDLNIKKVWISGEAF
jgi:N-acetylglucosamine-6-phosphate deacetylase